MKVAVLSGKGGAGKTFVSVNLAAAAASSVYVDCDVEAPNGHLFFRPAGLVSQPVMKKLPVVDEARCTSCRKCVDFCRFNALALVGKAPMIFKDVCHSCGGCVMVCPEKALTEVGVEIGHIETGHHGQVQVASGFLNIGEASGVAIIAQLLSQVEPAEDVVIDCPPGSACSVVESIRDADYCILVAEPTAFGVHNFEMVYELVRLLDKPCGVVINKAPTVQTVMDARCKEAGLSVLARIPYDPALAQLAANGQIAVENGAPWRALFTDIWQKITEGVCP